MSAADRCPECGAARPANAPPGACPHCLMRLGLDGRSLSLSGQGPAVTLDLGREGQPSGSVLDSIAATVGAVPRVLLRDTAVAEPPGPVLRPDGGDVAATSARYQFFGEIARGGMGAVLKGRDPDLGRDVAVKVLRHDHRGDPAMVRRFVEEAQIGGQLQHPGIIPIYELGVLDDHRPYFSMKLVKGHTLAALLGKRTGPEDGLARFLTIFESIAQTVAYAHARGVIHRDLKPSNVMVGSFGEVQVMDWGLAKVLPRGGIIDDAVAGKAAPEETVIATARSGAGDPDLSRAGSVMGTPSYMAPEQARGEVDRVGERVDVFALGSILCEILTGDPAFCGRTSAEIQRRAAGGETDDAFARLASCGADADLVALAAHCLARSPDDRPHDAGRVAARVGAYLAGVQEKLRRAELASIEERARRRLTMVAATAVVVLGFAGGAVSHWNQQQKAVRMARTARAVDDALADAARLRVEAQAAPAGETLKWAEALAAIKRAEGALDQGEAEPAQWNRVRALAAEVTRGRGAAEDRRRREQADRSLLAELESIRGGHAEHLDAKRTDSAYAAAFRGAGLDLDAIASREAISRLAARSKPIELVTYLDDWTAIRIATKAPRPSWARLVDVASGVDPDPWRNALRTLAGKPADQVAAELRRLADDWNALDTQPPEGLVLLARSLKKYARDDARAESVLLRAWRRRPDDFWINFELAQVARPDIQYGVSPELYPRPQDSVRYLSAAVAVRPRSSMAHYSLGVALNALGKWEEARQEVREASRLDPTSTAANEFLHPRTTPDHRVADVEARYRESLRSKPDDFPTTMNLAQLLLSQKRNDEAAEVIRTLIRARPEVASYHHGLGVHYIAVGDPAASLEPLRQAARLDGSHPGEAIWLLAEQCRRVGRLDESLATFQRVRQLVNGRTDEIRRADAEIARSEAIKAFIARLPSFLGVEERPRDAAEAVAFASLCSEGGQSAAAAWFIAWAIDADPKLVRDPHSTVRLDGARQAALAGSGRSFDDPPPDEAARARLRKQALEWSKAEYVAQAEKIASGLPGERASAIENLRRWAKETDFIGVREPERLARLPEDEQREWQAFWSLVEAQVGKE